MMVRLMQSVLIEPMLTDQWFCDAETLAKPALASVKEGRTNFVPKTWENTYYHWMENIQPWCISRQLWWGHQIPVWYAAFISTENDILKARKNDKEDASHPIQLEFIQVCAIDEEHALEEIKKKVPYDCRVIIGDTPLKQNDVLQMSLLEQQDDLVIVSAYRDPGWPDETPELERYYQTDVLVTGFDIIFFWVARMMMMGNHFMKDEAGAPVFRALMRMVWLKNVPMV